MATLYDTAILPARPRRPRDKANVEVAVLIIERWLLGCLRHRRFYSLAELNAAVGELLRQRPTPDPAARCHPPGAVRRARQAQPQVVADAALLLCRMARSPRVKPVG
jgi:transposase